MVEEGHKGNDTSTQGTRSAHSRVVFIWLHCMNPIIATLTGPSNFIGEYVTTRNIPIPRLLQALGVELVCEPSKLWLYSRFLKKPLQCPELESRKPKTMLYFLRVAMNHM